MLCNVVPRTVVCIELLWILERFCQNGLTLNTKGFENIIKSGHTEDVQQQCVAEPLNHENVHFMGAPLRFWMSLQINYRRAIQI